MESFIDTLGRLTEKQSSRIAKEAREHELEQQRLAATEMDQLHQESLLQAKELEVLERKMTNRRETLNMAWLGAELLKAAGVSKQDWIDTAPKLKTRGIIRRRQEIVGREERFAFDAWQLDKLDEKSTVYRDFYASRRSDLVLTENGDIGIARSKQYMHDMPDTYIKFRIDAIQVAVKARRGVESRFQVPLHREQAAQLKAVYLSSDEFCEKSELELLSRDCSGDGESYVQQVYTSRNRAGIDTTVDGFFDRLARSRVGEWLGDRGFDSLAGSIDNTIETLKPTNVDTHLRRSLANLLAVNGIKIS